MPFKKLRTQRQDCPRRVTGRRAGWALIWALIILASGCTGERERKAWQFAPADGVELEQRLKQMEW